MLGQLLDHRFTKQHASEFLDGGLSRADRERVQQHASVCPTCHALLASLRRVIGVLPDLAASRRGVADGVVERLRQDG